MPAVPAPSDGAAPAPEANASQVTIDFSRGGQVYPSCPDRSLFGVSSSELLSSKAFPARGFAKILSTEEAQKLNRYRSLVAAESNASVYHQATLFAFDCVICPEEGRRPSGKDVYPVHLLVMV